MGSGGVRRSDTHPSDRNAFPDRAATTEQEGAAAVREELGRGWVIVDLHIAW
jgi:hypothetical protein